MTYTIIDHIHNYAVWTAARSVQRNFTDTKTIKSAIDQTNLKTFIETKKELTKDQFDSFHQETARTIIYFLNSLGIQTSFGRAAKIIAIYLKTSVIIRDSGSSCISKIAHPPIDNILLTSLNKEYPSLGLKGIKWTQLKEEDYYELINKLRTLNLAYFWEIEKHWIPVQND